MTQLGVRPYLIRGLVALSIATNVVVLAIRTIEGWPLGLYTFGIVVMNVAIGITYLGVGWLIAERRAGNPVGPLLMLIGALYAAFQPVDLYLSALYLGTDASELALAGHGVVFLALLSYVIGVALAVALILIPDGRPPSPRWWWIIATGVAMVGLGGIGYIFGSTTFGPVYSMVESPFAVSGFPKRALVTLGDAGAQGLAVAAALSILVRWRRGGRVVRAQVTWVAVAGIAVVATGYIAEISNDGVFDWGVAITAFAQSLAAASIPLSIGIAIMRYHLFEIDRIVSRTIGYIVVSSILGAAFMAGILIGSTILAGYVAEDSPVIVAASTLLAFALFQPVRRRVQRVVDRRFHRRHYDAVLAVEGFAARSRGGTDLPKLTRDLRLAAVDACEPMSSAVWIRATRT